MLKRQYFIVNIFCWRYFIIPSWIVLSNNSLAMGSFLILLSFSGNPGERSVFIFSYNSPLAPASFSLLFPCLRHKLPASVSLQWHHSVSQFSSVTHSCLFVTPWTAAHQTSLSTHQLPESTQTHVPESVMPFNHLILCCPLLLLPPIPPSIRLFSNESVLRIRWPNYWSFSFSISPSNEYPGLISFRIYGFDLLPVQGTFKSVLQHHN